MARLLWNIGKSNVKNPVIDVRCILIHSALSSRYASLSGANGQTEADGQTD